MIIRIEERPSKRRGMTKRVKIMRCDNCDVTYEKNMGVPQCRHDFCSRKCFCDGTRKGGKRYEAVQAARVETFRENWGADNVFANDDVKRRIREGNIERWGAENPMQTEKGKQLFRDAMLEKYGVENSMHLQDVVERVCTSENRAKALKTMKQNGTIRESKQEREFVQYLQILFGKADVIEHPSRDECGGWNVDCKVLSLDTYIEYDGCPWHGFNNNGTSKSIDELSEGIKRAVYNDAKQNEWFRMNGKKLLRIKCVDWARLCGLPYYKRPVWCDIIDASPTWAQIIAVAHVVI